MCVSDAPEQKTPARTPSVPVLPPNMLHLGSAAKRQLSGGGNGVSSLRIGGKLTKTNVKRADKKSALKNKSQVKNPYNDFLDNVNKFSGLDKLPMGLGNKLRNNVAEKQRNYEGSKAYEKQLKIQLSE